MRAIFANDIRIISASIINPVSIKIYFIIEECSIESTKRAKSICCKKNAIGDIKSHHSLRPVNHRSFDKDHLVRPKRSSVPFFDFFFTIFMDMKAKLMHLQERFFGADHFNVRIAQKNFINGCRVIRLHMVNDHIIQVTTIQNSCKIV